MARKAYRPVITSDGWVQAHEFSGNELEKISFYWARVGRAYETGDIEALRSIPTVAVRDTSGRTYKLSTDPNRVFRQVDSLSQPGVVRFSKNFGG